MTKTDQPIAEALLNWYDAHARALPWRIPPIERKGGIRPDPYRVWLSEIMLQQTTVATVKSYFEKFTAIWPTVNHLSAATEDQVLREWAGLGYYSRARNLKKCADIVVCENGGLFPKALEALRALPGIGDYTSAAIAAIAFDKPAAVVDGNVERVYSRLFEIDTPLPQAKSLIKAKVAETLSPDRPGDFAQATMDLGATICTPKKPVCLHCPLNDHCLALANSQPENFPIKAPKKSKPKRLGAAFVALSPDGEVLLEQRPPTGLLASMAQVPTTAWNARQNGETDKIAAPFPAEWEHCGSINHVFTHFELELTVWRAHNTEPKSANRWWVAPENLNNEALPTVMNKVIARALESTQ